MPAYFTTELFQFLTRLKRNNKREWFQAHKDEWETCVRQPVLRFITDFAAALVRDFAPSRRRSPSLARFHVSHLPRHALLP